MVGYPPNEGSGYLVMNPKTRRVTRVYSCVFEEDIVGLKGHHIDSTPAQIANEEGEHKVETSSAPVEASSAEPGDLSTTESDDEPDVNSGGVESEPEAVTEEHEEPDTWNRVYKTRASETLRQVAAAHGVPVRDLQLHNYDLPGSCKKTGLTDPDAELQAGTGLWLPDESDSASDGESSTTNEPRTLTLADFIRPESGITLEQSDETQTGITILREPCRRSWRWNKKR